MKGTEYVVLNAKLDTLATEMESIKLIMVSLQETLKENRLRIKRPKKGNRKTQVLTPTVKVTMMDDKEFQHQFKKVRLLRKIEA